MLNSGTILSSNFTNIQCSSKTPAVTFNSDGVVQNSIFKDGSDGNALNFQQNGEIINSKIINWVSTSFGTVYISGFGTVEMTIFQNCSGVTGGGIYMASSGTLSNCTFISCFASSQGGAVLISGGTITNCIFMNTSSNSYGGAVVFNLAGTVLNSYFYNAYSNNSAGAIYSSMYEVYVENSTFTNCSTLNYGGAIGGVACVENSMFINCSSYEGGGIYLNHYSSAGRCISNTTFIGCIGMGAAVFFNTDSSTVTDCIAINCSTNTDSVVSGGAFYFQLNGTVSNSYFYGVSSGWGAVFIRGFAIVENYVFTNCSALNGAGVGLSGEGILTNCTFNECSASSGAAGYFYSAGVTITDCYVNNCFAENVAGGFYFASSGTVLNSYFTGLISQGYGMLYFNSNGTVENSIFTNCSSTVHYLGGIVFLAYGTLSNCTFIECSAISGSAAYFMLSGSVTDSVVINCTSLSNGGAFYFNQNGSVSNTYFQGIDSQFGAVYFIGANAYLINSTFSAVSGGVAYFRETGIVLDCNFLQNIGNTLNFQQVAEIDRSYFEGNSGESVVIFSFGGTIKNSTFVNCSTSGDGVVSSYHYLTVENSVFTNCNAVHGGGIYINNTGLIENTSFINCTAVYGGGIYCASCSLNYLLIENNFAEMGGGIFLQSGTIEYSSFIENSASSNGAALYCTGSSCTLSYTLFRQNSISSNSICSGGAIYMDGYDSSCNSGIFEENSIIDCDYSNGGAVFVSPNVMYISFSNTSFSNNYIECNASLVSFGAAIYSYDLFDYQSLDYSNNTLSCWDTQYPEVQAVFISSQNNVVYANNGTNSVNCTVDQPCDIYTAFNNARNKALVILYPGEYILTSTIVLNRKNLTISGTNGEVKITSTGSIFQMIESSISFSDIQFGPFISDSNLSLNILNFDDKSSSTIKNCEFNSIQSSLPIVYSLSKLTIINTNFNNCSVLCNLAQCRGGALNSVDTDIVNSTFINNGIISTSSDTNCYGGAVYSQVFSISQTSFDSNYLNCKESFGGALFIENIGDNFSLSLENITFTNNRIYVSSYSNECSNANGAAVYIDLTNNINAQINITDCTFSFNAINSKDYITCDNGNLNGGGISMIIFLIIPYIHILHAKILYLKIIIFYLQQQRWLEVTYQELRFIFTMSQFQYT